MSVLEGGYNVPILAGSVAAHLHALGAKPGQISPDAPDRAGVERVADSTIGESNDPDGI